MTKILAWFLTVLLVLMLPAGIEAGGVQTSIIPQETQWLLHFDMQRFLATQLSRSLLGDENNKLSQANRKVSEYFKIDLFKDITGITIFGPEKNEKMAVVGIRGNFDKEHIMSLLDKARTHKEISYKKHTIHQWRDSQFGVFADDHLVIFGRDESTIKSVLDVMTGKKKSIARTTLMSALNEIPDDAFIKAVVNDISSLIKDDAKAVLLKQASMAFFMALEKNGDLKLKLKLTTDSADTAKNIEHVVQGLVSLVKLQQHEGTNPGKKLLENLKVLLRGNTLQLELSYPSEELVRMFVHEKQSLHLSF